MARPRRARGGAPGDEAATSARPASARALRALVFVSGAVLMGLEIAGSRLLAPHFGSSIYVWGSLITVFLTALAAGTFVGGRIADRRPSLALLATLCVAAAALVLVVPVAGHALCRALLDAGLLERSGPLVASFVLFLPPSFLLGMISPFSVRLAARDLASVGRAAGTLYALSTAGSIAGTLVTAFVLVPAIGVTSILRGLGVAQALVPLVLLALHRSRARAVALAALLAGAVALPASPSAVLPAANVVRLERDTPYHHVAVVDSGGSERFLQFDAVYESAISLAPPYPSLAAYTHYFPLAFLLAGRMETALFVGAGGGIGPRQFLALVPSLRVDLVDIDPVVLDVAHDWFYVPRTPALRAVAADGRIFLHRPDAGPYDCIVLDAFTIGGRLPFHLATREYFTLVRSHLRPGGVLAMNVIGSLEGPTSVIPRSVARTLRSVFPQVYSFATGQRNDARVRQAIVFLATGDERRLEPSDLAARLARFPDQGTAALADLRERLAAEVQLPSEPPWALLLTDDWAPLDTMRF